MAIFILQYEDYKDNEPLSLEQLESVLSEAQKQAEQENKQLCFSEW
jgi:biopolymer transport protein TolR